MTVCKDPLLSARQSVHGVHLAVRRTHSIAYSCLEALWQHLPSSSEKMPADAAGLLSHDYWAALEASLGSLTCANSVLQNI